MSEINVSDLLAKTEEADEKAPEVIWEEIASELVERIFSREAREAKEKEKLKLEVKISYEEVVAVIKTLEEMGIERPEWLLNIKDKIEQEIRKAVLKQLP